jgi:hypothetical protein
VSRVEVLASDRLLRTPEASVQRAMFGEPTTLMAA